MPTISIVKCASGRLVKQFKNNLLEGRGGRKGHCNHEYEANACTHVSGTDTTFLDNTKGLTMPTGITGGGVVPGGKRGSSVFQGLNSS